MNPQRAAHLGAGPVSQPDGHADPGGNGEDQNAGIGSAQAGYASPDQGPFECANCVHFDGQSHCDNPQVASDPEVNGEVEPEGCCNFFRPGGGETNEEEHGETEAIPGAGEGGQ